MSDEDDERMHSALIQLIGSYAMFSRLFRELPVPIELPHGMITGLEMRAALARTAKLASDQPMPEDQQLQLERACLMWLTADVLLSLFRHEEEGSDHLAAAAMHCILVADDSALDLGEWIVGQERPQEE